MRHMSRMPRMKVAANVLNDLFPAIYAFKSGGQGYIKTTNSFAPGSFTYASKTGATYNSNHAIYANGKLTVVGYNGANTDIWHSIDGTNFTRSGNIPGNSGAYDLKSIAYGNGKYVAVATADYLFYSSDGITWTQATTPLGGNNGGGRVTSVCFGNGKFVVSGLNDKVITSTDGINWTTVATGKALGVISYVNNKWFGSGYPGSTQFVSDDGVNWTANGAYLGSNVVYCSGWYVLAGADGKIYVSMTGLTGSWVVGASGLTRPSSNLVTRGQDLAYGTANGYVVYSRDGGATWSQQYFGGAYNFSAIVLP